MTEVQFHFNVPDRLHYACRLLRKGLRSGAPGLTVSGPFATLSRLDKALWTFDPQDFIPHLLLRDDETVPERLARTPIWLVERAQRGAHHPVLVHLGEEPAHGFESFERLIEIVSTDDAQREAGRQRWKHYAGRGYSLKRFDAAAS